MKRKRNQSLLIDGNVGTTNLHIITDNINTFDMTSTILLDNNVNKIMKKKSNQLPSTDDNVRTTNSQEVIDNINTFDITSIISWRQSRHDIRDSLGSYNSNVSVDATNVTTNVTTNSYISLLESLPVEILGKIISSFNFFQCGYVRY
jgi:hypothetical protein